MGKADLHIHTSASDGEHTPQELILKVQSKNLQTIAITDHDTIKGYMEAKSPAADAGIELMSGVELSVLWDSREIHILAYAFDDENRQMLELLAHQKKARQDRMKEIIRLLKKQGVDVSYDEVWAESGTGNVGRPHAASVMIRKGYVSTVNEAFIRYLSYEKLGTVQTGYAELGEAIKIVQQAGGVVSVAHPGRLYSDSEMEELLNFDIDGIECIHPSHSFSVQKKFSDLARSRHLLITGGSDFHGRKKSEYDPFLGVVTLGEQHVAALKRTANSRKKMIP